MAAAAGGSLHLVAAASQVLVEVAGTRAGLDVDRLQRALLEAARKKAAESLKGDFGEDELERTLITRLGRPEHVLAEIGRELGADGFVLGGRPGSGPVLGLRRGTASHLLRVCKAPVILTGRQGSAVERVIAAVDRSFAARATIEAAHRAAVLLGVPLGVVHVVARPAVPSGLVLDFDLDAAVRSAAEEVEEDLRGLLPNGVELTVLRGEVEPSLVRAAESGPPALLALGAQGRGWVHRLILGSTTEALLAELPSSLLVVPSAPSSKESDG
jgi:nucleotide-binding universal stress UspA family protein